MTQQEVYNELKEHLELFEKTIHKLNKQLARNKNVAKEPLFKVMAFHSTLLAAIPPIEAMLFEFKDEWKEYGKLFEQALEQGEKE